ncbi:MAG: HAMP domain-containing histidine kinase [Roseburia sp.]|nr:HAMP domain-containing histidine kinase [Roseburia sp.]
MMKKLTARTFLFLLLLSLFISLLAYGCIWIFLPYANEQKAQHALERKSEQYAALLRGTKRADSGPVFMSLLHETDMDFLVTDGNGTCINPFTLEQTDEQVLEGEPYPFRFADSTEEYLLITRYNSARSAEITKAMQRSIPYVLLSILLLSGVGAFLFSHYTTLPIIRISRIADKIASLDFSWYCPDMRDDEIGALSQSINELSDKLHAALEEITRRNALLEDEIALERERERRRLLFFSGVSHELKTPIATVIGQLEGMQAQIGVYRDREKYLARSTEILQSLNRLIREMLAISRLDLETQTDLKPVCLSALVRSLLEDYADYAALFPITVSSEIASDIQVYGDAQLLQKALGNVIGNAILHSQENGRVTVALSPSDSGAVFSVHNAPAHIDERHLPHLFDAFYRVNRSEQGSGLGLYITRMILETYHVPHSIENTADGVRFCAVFEGAEKS